MLSIANHIGLNLNKQKLQLVEVVRESSKYCLENVEEHIFNEKISLNNLELIPILQAALDQISNRTLLKSSNISISLPVSEFLFFEINYESSISSKALEEHIAWEFSILFPELESNDFLIRNIPLRNNDKQNKMLIIATPKKLIETLFRFAKQNSFKLKFVDYNHFSSDLNIILNENKTTLSIFVDFPFISLNSYIGKNLNATNTFHMDDEETKLQTIVDFIESKNIVYDKVYMASSAENDELKFNLEERIQKPIDLLNPFEFIPTSESFIQNAHYMNKPNTFSSASGIGFRKF